MSAATYRAAQVRAVEAAGLAGVRRRKVADAIADRSGAGEDVADIAWDYGITVEDGYEITVAVLAGDRRRHHLTAAQAARIDREVWACGG